MRLSIFAALLGLMLLPAAAQAEKNEIPFREDSGLTKAEFLFTVGQYTAALDTVNDVLLRHPSNADAYTYRGYAYARLGETESAAKNFRKALEINPTHLGANKYLADIYLEEGDMSRALEQLQVIRMTCGNADCEELRALKRAIDLYKRGEAPANGAKKDKKQEE